MTTEKNKQSFISKSIQCHGEGRYDYSKIEYKGMKEKVKIGCNECGTEFWQYPYDHQRGQGCKVCFINRRTKGTEKFIQEASELHGEGRYDYSKVDYKNANTKVDIGCNKCGRWFKQVPYSHLQGRGCSVCRIEETRLGNKVFVEKSEEVHGKGKYDYSRVKYIRKDLKVEIKCAVHGWFWQTAQTHMDGHGCPKCANIQRGEHRKKTTEDFINASKEKFGDRFDYSKTEYTYLKENITVTCKKHGDVTTTAENHIRSIFGCPKCAKEERESGGWGLAGFYGTDNPSHLYVMEIRQGEDKWLKVGLSVDPENRAKEIKRSFEGGEVEILQVWSGPARKLFEEGELYLLKESGIDRYIDDDWQWAGYTECFPYEVKDELFDKTEELMQSLQGVERIL